MLKRITLFDLFNPEIIDGNIGLKVFSFLDDQDLGNAAQVNRRWHKLVHDMKILQNPSLFTLPDSLIPTQQHLIRDILESTHAIKDPFSPLIQKIRGALRRLSKKQQSEIKRYFPNLIDPFWSLYPWHFMRHTHVVEKEDNLTFDHKAFKRVKEVIGILERFSGSLLVPLVQQLKNEYQGYIQKICSLSVNKKEERDQRELLLSPVFLQGDFLNESYLISKSVAYELLSMGELGIPEKMNITGSSIVTHVGTIYAKQNLVRARKNEKTSTETPNPRKEWAMGSFQHLLFREGLVPSSLEGHLSQEEEDKKQLIEKTKTPTGTLDPGMEWAMGSFHRLLFGEGLVPSSLLVLSAVPVDGYLSQKDEDNKKRLIKKAKKSTIAATNRKIISDRLHEDVSFKSTQTYALQVTPEIKGEFLGVFLEHALKDPALFETLDLPQIQGLILSTMITHPADAKGDNFIVTYPNERGKCQIISIDNDLSLASMIIQEKPDFHTLEARNILFCIPTLMHQKLESEVRERFLSHNPTSFLLTWLKSIEDHNHNYQDLMDLMEEKTALLLRIPLKLKEGTGAALLDRFQGLQHHLHLNTSPSLQDLFEIISPLAAHYIKTLLEKEGCPLKVFDHVYRQDFFYGRNSKQG